MAECLHKMDKLTRLAVAAYNTHDFGYSVAVTSPGTPERYSNKGKGKGVSVQEGKRE